MTRELVASKLQEYTPLIKRLCSHYYWKYLSGMQACCYSLDDLYQEVVLKALRAASSYQEGNFGGWVHVVVRTVSITLVHKSKKHQALLEPYLTAPTEPDELLIKKERALALYTAIEQLSVRQGVAVLDALAYQNHEDRAKDLGITYNNMRNSLHQAKEKLRTSLHHHNPLT